MMKDYELAILCRDAYKHCTHKNERYDAEALFSVDSNYVIVAFRGTERDYDDILTDIRLFPWYSKELGTWCHKGFLLSVRSIYLILLRDIYRAIEGKRIILTGHSLGGAMAQIFAAMLVSNGIKVANIITFGAPRAGGAGLKSITKDISGNRYVCGSDIVPTVPHRFPIPYRHDRAAIKLSGAGHLFEDHRINNYIDSLK